MTQETLAQRLWLAAQTDAPLLVRLRANYSGRQDVLDALVRRSQPQNPIVATDRDRAVKFAELQAQVYSRKCLVEPLVDQWDPVTAQTVTATAAEHQLRTLTAELSADATALDSLLERMRDWTPPSSPDGSPTNRPGPAASSATATAPPGDSRGVVLSLLASAGRRLAPRNRSALFAQGTMLGLILGTVATLGSLGVIHSSGRGEAANSANDQSDTSTTAAAAAAPAIPATPAPDTGVLQIFDEEADWKGGESPRLGSEYRPESIRSVLGSAPAETGFGVYVAQRGAAEYCIIVQDADGSGSTACATLRTIALSGLHLHALAWSPPRPDANAKLLQIYVTWTRTGAIVAGSVPRASGNFPPFTGSTPGQDPAV